jgi:hypothetical protein
MDDLIPIYRLEGDILYREGFSTDGFSVGLRYIRGYLIHRFPKAGFTIQEFENNMNYRGNTMKNTIMMTMLIVFLTQISYAQTLCSTKYDSSLFADADYIPDEALVNRLNPRKPLWIPAVEAIGLNLALGAFNTYVGGSEFAKISFHTIEHNFERGWTTDADGFITNLWAHPFHGSIYYNFARSSGYNYWTSLGIATLGSWQWEYFMENEPPALNDWIMTSFGGSMLGEMFYRFSNLILNESLSGWPRFWNELGAGIFNPGRLINRLVYGRTARRIPEKLYERRVFLGQLSLGANNVAEGASFENGKSNGIFSMDFAYGRLFEMQKYKPFDFFRFYMLVNFGGEQPPIGQFRIYGILHGKNSTVGEKSKFLWGIFNHFDYLENNVYQVGGTSVGLGIGYRTPHQKSVQFMGILHGAALLMGGANSDYSEEYKVAFLDSARTYNLGPGAHAKLETVLRFPYGSLYVGYSFWWIHTWDGAPGDEFIGMWTPALRIRIFGRWSVGLEYLLYHRVGKYDDFPDRDYRNNEQRLFVGYAF